MVLRVLSGVQVQTEVANRGILHAAWIEARLVCQLVRSKGLLLRLGVHLVHLEWIHILKVLLWLEMMVHWRLKRVEGDAWMSSMQTTVHSSLRSRHG